MRQVPIIPEYLFELDHPNETAEFDTLIKTKNLSFFDQDFSQFMKKEYPNSTLGVNDFVSLETVIKTSKRNHQETASICMTNNTTI